MHISGQSCVTESRIDGKESIHCFSFNTLLSLAAWCGVLGFDDETQRLAY